MSASWPDGAPETLWRYKELQLQSMPQIPMMGAHFTNQFLVAFGLGLAFLCYFAWERFNTRPPGAIDFRYRVMKEVCIADLGGTAALRQAYFLYLVTMLFLYISMTFFGKLIVQTLTDLKVVGISVDSTSLEFDKPQWPLLLAFGFAGLAPSIPPLQRAEAWLFQRAYRAVGIPVRINETTRNLISVLDIATVEKPSDEAKLTDELNAVADALNERLKGDWLSMHIAPTKVGDSIGLLAQLELLAGWAKRKRGAWPSSEVSETVRNLEQLIADQADDLLEDFERHAQGKSASGVSKTAQTEKFVAETLQRARGLRDDLVAILAVYFERDPDVGDPSVSDRSFLPSAGLRDLLERAEQPNMAGTGPETGVLILIVISLPIYAMLTWQGLHSLAPRATRDNLNVVLATAGVSGLLLISVAWFPLLVAFAVRQHLFDDREWSTTTSASSRSTYVLERLVVVGMGLIASVIFLSLTAGLWAFLTARDVNTFEALFVRGANPFLLYYASLAIMTVPLLLFSLAAADARLRGPPSIYYGLVSAFLVSACQVVHLFNWYGGKACTTDAAFLTDLFARDCFAFYNGFDLILLPLLAFLAAFVFGNAKPKFVLQGRKVARRADPVTAAVLLAMSGVLLCLSAPSSMAVESVSKIEVRVGFRADVEPFSYKVKADLGMPSGDQPRYKGFLGDLCYWIFEGSEYTVREVNVTAVDRFEKLDTGEIDVLCDPVTLRFGARVDPQTNGLKPRPSHVGVFSPIVFASGITYLERRDRTPGKPVFIGYVAGTTAQDILSDLCKVDLFHIVPQEEHDDIPIMCATAFVAYRLASLNPCEPDETFLPPSPAICKKYLRAGSAGDDFEQLLTTTEGYKRLLGAVWQAAKDERASVERREEGASGSAAKMFLAADRQWADLIAKIGMCQTSPTACTRKSLLDQLSANCSLGTGSPETTGSGDKTVRWQRTIYRFCPFPSHEKLVDWFCNAGNKGRGTVYLGDREIILAKVRTWNETHDAKCVVDNDNGAGDLTYEPYALMVARPNCKDAANQIKIAELVQRRVYEFFSFTSLARAKFDTYFLGTDKDRIMSMPLAYLFLLNGVEDERRFLLPVPSELPPVVVSGAPLFSGEATKPP